MATAADSGAQLVCPVCKEKRFFVYLLDDAPQVVCVKCGSRADNLTRPQEVPA